MAPRPMSAQPASKSDSACKQSGLNPGSLLLQPGVIKEGKPLIHPVNKSVNLRSEVESARIQHGYRAWAWPIFFEHLHQRSISQVRVQGYSRSLKNAKASNATVHISVGLIDNDTVATDVTAVDAILRKLPGEGGAGFARTEN